MISYKFVGKDGRMYEYDEELIKENSNCPASEKSGTGPGSCGGSTGKSSSTEVSPNDDVFSPMEKSGKLDKVNHIYSTKSAKSFMKDYAKGKAGEYKSSGPTEEDNKNAENLYTKYEEIPIRSGFAGSGDTVFKDKSTGDMFLVEKSPNGKTFYGTDHRIRKISEQELSKRKSEKY